MAWLEQWDNQIKKSSDLIVAFHNSYRRFISRENTKWIKYNIVLALMSDRTSKDIHLLRTNWTFTKRELIWKGQSWRPYCHYFNWYCRVGYISVFTDIIVLLCQGEGGWGSLYPHCYLSLSFFGIFFCTLRQNKSAIQSEIVGSFVYIFFLTCAPSVSASLIPLWGSRLMWRSHGGNCWLIIESRLDLVRLSVALYHL